MFSYRSLLKQAWEVCWKHKYLWFLGLFASLTAAGGSWEYQLLAQNFNQGMIDGSYSRLSAILTLADVVKNFFWGIVNLFSYDFLTILNALSLLIIAFVFSLNLMIKIVISLVFFITGLPLLFMALSSTPILVTVYTVLFVILVPVAVSLSLLLKYAIAYRVLDNKSFVSALENAGKLFSKNWLVSLEMAIILFIINFLASIVVLVILSLFLLPLLLLGLMFQIGWLIIMTMLLAISLIIIFGSILTTFQVTTWTNLFLRLKDKGAMAKLERVFSH